MKGDSEVNVILYLLLAFVLTKIPVMGKYLRMVNTIIHEICHIVIATVTGGKGHRIALNRDTSGLAITSSSSWFSRIFTAYAGYTGASLTALLLFYLLHRGQYMAVLSLFLVLSIVATVLWIRNGYGLLWSGSFIVLMWLLVDNNLYELSLHISYLLASVLLVESITSAAHIMMVSIIRPKDAGDATNLQQATFIPAAIWGILFFVQAVYIGYKVIQDFVI